MNQLPWENISWKSLVTGQTDSITGKYLTTTQLKELERLGIVFENDIKTKNGLIHFITASQISKIEEILKTENELISKLVDEFKEQASELTLDVNALGQVSSDLIQKHNSLIENIGYVIFCMVSNKRPKNKVFQRLGYYTLSQRGFKC